MCLPSVNVSGQLMGAPHRLCHTFRRSVRRLAASDKALTVSCRGKVSSGRQESERVTHIAVAIDGLQQPVSHLLRGCGGRCHCLLGANRPTGEKSSGFKGLMDSRNSQTSREDWEVAEPHVSDVIVGLRNGVCVCSVGRWRFDGCRVSPPHCVERSHRSHELHWIKTSGPLHYGRARRRVTPSRRFKSIQPDRQIMQTGYYNIYLCMCVKKKK